MSNETKWTPGPWFINSSWHTHEIMAEDQYDNLPIADVMTLIDGELDSSEQDHDEIERQSATALLIAAAPDLYEALDTLLDELNSTPELNLSCWGVDTTSAAIALAKARGEIE